MQRDKDRRDEHQWRGKLGWIFHVEFSECEVIRETENFGLELRTNVTASREGVSP